MDECVHPNKAGVGKQTHFQQNATISGKKSTQLTSRIAKRNFLQTGKEMPFELSFIPLEILLFISTIVVMVARRLRVPYAVGLVMTGILLAYVPLIPKIALSKDLIYVLFLPPLIFEAALYIHWKHLHNDLPLILVLATLGVIIAAGITTMGMHYLAKWGWGSAAIFGTLIAATDPVAVIAAIKEAKIKGRLPLLLEAESLFNDGTAAVLFGVTVLIVTGTNITIFDISLELLKTVLGGLICGAFVAAVVLVLAGRTNDHLVEITFTTLAAYGSFLLAEQFHFSGVLATITAGLMVGNIGPLGSITPRGREAVESFWEYAAFVINSLVFILIGLAESALHFSGAIIAILIAIALVTVGRACIIYLFGAIFSHTKYRILRNHQHVLFWGGFRGALALALVLGLPIQIPRYEEIITLTFAVVAFSILFQGLTINPLLHRLGLFPKQDIPNKIDSGEK
jgi:monovalent cation:H+ antiporter, CPA1 family